MGHGRGRLAHGQGTSADAGLTRIVAPPVVVVDAAITHAQVKRFGNQVGLPDMGFFGSEEQAMGWLFED